jgi:hypothetical protein
VNNTGYPASLEVGKLYRIIADREAEKHGYLRVVDESGEDYGYASDRFFPLDIPTKLKTVLRAASRNSTKRRAPTRSRPSPARRPAR